MIYRCIHSADNSFSHYVSLPYLYLHNIADGWIRGKAIACKNSALMIHKATLLREQSWPTVSEKVDW